ncbi:MORC family CW-type zinc finger protein 3-like isoform X2 [Macadamia integrifolia]|uniref:MORC family CW-type zinc finger protein 3-like isoform X2 n=1 Tax=Macadamia integrifolia TaxID=60698 RepID=UPI001C4F6373|nr:MORC family CW-type zinc finger protein 3-like isoform X2 [Macadamia integrifolia]
MGFTEACRNPVRRPERNSSKYRCEISGKKMTSLPIDLNEPPLQDGSGRCVMLSKDQKTISRTRCYNPPVELAWDWRISELRRRASVLQISRLPKFFLQADPLDSRQQHEWPLFMGFLQKHDKVAIVEFESFVFYILPPDTGAITTHAVVAYREKSVASGHTFPKLEELAPARVIRTPNFGMLEEFSGSSETNVGERVVCAKKQHSDHEFQQAAVLCVSHGSVEEACRSQSREQKKTIFEKNFACDSEGFSKINLEKQLPDIKFQQEVMGHYARGSRDEAHCGSQPMSVPQDNSFGENFVRVDPGYLKTLGQSHSGWVFGAIAELVDNSRDAKAANLDISIENVYFKILGKDIPMLSVIDDGRGMSHKELVRMVSFGCKQPNVDDPDRVGRFGIGFKTGAMRLGQDAFVLSQTTDSRCIAFLSQSLNEDKDNLEIPILSYSRRGQVMEIDTTVQSKELADYNLKRIKDFSPFDEYFIGVKSGLFSEKLTGTQIYIWNLDKWGSEYCLEWQTGRKGNSSCDQGDILIRSRRIRSRPGQISQKVPLDYSLRSYMEVIFLDPRMKISVQGSLVKTRPLARSLNRTVVVEDTLLGKPVKLTLGRSQLEWEQMNCGMFLYWHGRLIEAYKRVGGMVYNADMGRGVIGVIDVTDLMDDGNGCVWVHNNKQGFQDCQPYAELEQWLGIQSNVYWDKNFDTLEVRKKDAKYKPDHEWVQCDKCRKWRVLPSGFDSNKLPDQCNVCRFCQLPPFKGECAKPEQQTGRGIITIDAKRSQYGTNDTVQKFTAKKKLQDESEDESSQIMAADIGGQYGPESKTLRTGPDYESDCDSRQITGKDMAPGLKRPTRTANGSEGEDIGRRGYKRLRRGPSRRCNQPR